MSTPEVGADGTVCWRNVAVVVLVSLPRTYLMSIVSPEPRRPIALRSSAASVIFSLLTSTMMSSTCNPASSAAEPGSTIEIRAPLSTSISSALATSRSIVWIETPSRPRRTSPWSSNCRMIELAIVVGTANPIPTLPPERLMIAELMPTSSPRMLTSAPPELPGLIDASV